MAADAAPAIGETNELDTQPAIEDRPTQPATPPEPVAVPPAAPRPSHSEILKRLRLGGSYIPREKGIERNGSLGAALALPSWQELRSNTKLLALLAAALLAAVVVIFLALQGSASSKKSAAEIRIEKQRQAAEAAGTPATDDRKAPATDKPAPVDSAADQSAPSRPVKPVRPVAGQQPSQASDVAEPVTEPTPAQPAPAPSPPPPPPPPPDPGPGGGGTP